MPIARPGSRRLLRDLLRWVVALAIVVFLVVRLVRDWTVVRSALTTVDWSWLLVGAVVAAAYFVFRVLAWQELLGSVGVRGRFATTARVWMNGEVVRYIPGNVWSVLGRLAQSPRLGAERSVVFASMVLEVLLLLASAAGLSAVALLPYPGLQLPARNAVLVTAAIASLLVLLPAFVRWVVRFISIILRRREAIATSGRTALAFPAMLAAWLTFGVAHLAVVLALGVSIAGSQWLPLVGAFVVSWLVGYLSFITPSGIGVREAVLVALLTPYVSVPLAILIAAVSRMLLTLVELAVLAVVNLLRGW